MNGFSKKGLVLSLALVASVALAIEPRSRVESGDATTVVVDITVEHRGEGVSGLTAENFLVREDGVEREVVSAAPAGPASIVLLVENSLHSWRYLNDVRSAMRGFLKAAPEGKGHSYALVTYERRPMDEQSLTQELARIRAEFKSVEQSAWGQTDTYDSIARTLEAMRPLPGRRVLIFIGVGYDLFSRHTFGELAEKVEADDVQVYGFATGSEPRELSKLGVGAANMPDLEQGEMLLRMLAQRSGGKWFCPSCEADYLDSMRDTMNTLDRQYTVVYQRPEPLGAGFHKLKVEAFTTVDGVRRNFQVRARDGWRAELSQR
jgi:VWFA-related protein